jgi:hypothetical protein
MLNVRLYGFDREHTASFLYGPRNELLMLHREQTDYLIATFDTLSAKHDDIKAQRDSVLAELPAATT